MLVRLNFSDNFLKSKALRIMSQPDRTGSDFLKAKGKISFKIMVHSSRWFFISIKLSNKKKSYN